MWSSGQKFGGGIFPDGGEGTNFRLVRGTPHHPPGRKTLHYAF